MTLAQFQLAFITIFAAMNVLTTAPIYLSLTEGMDALDRPQLVRRAMFTAGAVAVATTLAGTHVLGLIGIQLSDIQLAGGMVLVALALHDLVFSREDRKSRNVHDVGPVPIGVPLVVGPGAITTLIVHSDTSGTGITLVALVINVAFAWFVLRSAPQIVRVLGQDGVKAFGKVMTLLLAGIGVSMFRAGLADYFG